MAAAECPSCDARVELGPRPRLGQRTVCAACEVELEVVWTDPLELDWYFEEDEYEAHDTDESDFEELRY